MLPHKDMVLLKHWTEQRELQDNLSPATEGICVLGHPACAFSPSTKQGPSVRLACSKATPFLGKDLGFCSLSGEDSMGLINGGC